MHRKRNGFTTNFTNLSVCTGADSLECLKASHVQTLRIAALYISGLHTYTWAPVIGDSFLPQSLSQATINVNVNIDYGFGMYNEFEGENFIPPGLKSPSDNGSPSFNFSPASFNTWVRGFLLNFSERSIGKVESLYPSVGEAEVVGSYSITYLRAQLVLACPAYWMARTAHRKSYVGEYTIAPTQHANDTLWVLFSPSALPVTLRPKIQLTLFPLQWNRPSSIQSPTSLTYLGFTGSFASFFQMHISSRTPASQEYQRTG
jgi:hypothetical protein